MRNAACPFCRIFRNQAIAPVGPRICFEGPCKTVSTLRAALKTSTRLRVWRTAISPFGSSDSFEESYKTPPLASGRHLEVQARSLLIHLYIERVHPAGNARE